MQCERPGGNNSTLPPPSQERILKMSTEQRDGEREGGRERERRHRKKTVKERHGVFEPRMG